ncbi:AraC family transcriptional regulator [Vitreoscilla massiliensis]|uniref:AraC family transcriptional regulator n=1 Tax=Vitreoscilla massiliensis TaxID=1689272 RepID=A0ABY4E6J4_9NEIS|nr:AraC family transcriptional regulator [Vitreoscilla massiliensis]UOO90510.1 AraC family transcriptional regulator [Vitreoscilla massiliensis]
MNSDTHFWYDPAWPALETRTAHNSRACYRMHSHRAHSFGCVDAGVTVLSFADGTLMPLQAGDVLWLPAELAHCCNPPPQEHWAYQMMYVAASVFTTAPAHAHTIMVWRDPALYQRFQHLHQSLQAHLPLAHKQAVLLTLLHEVLHELAYPPLWQHTPQPYAPDPRLNALLQQPDFLHWNVAHMARSVHMSRYHFMRWFQAQTGWSAHAYQVNVRIAQARQRLRAGDAIAAVAHDLGFADQSHFQRVFKAHTAATPKQYQ